jgi:ABC-2 type transport system permease protein
MRLLVSLMGKDLRRRLAAPSGILVSLAIPLALATTMALALGNRSGQQSVPPLDVVVVDLDNGPLSNMIAGASQNADAADKLVITRAATPQEGLDLMRDEGRHAMLVIPEGFSEAVLNGRAADIELVKNPSRQIMPIVAQQGLEVVGLYGSIGARFLPEGGAARIEQLFKGEGWDDAVGIAALITDTYIRIKRTETLLLPPVIKVDKVKEDAPEEEEESDGFNFMGWMYPGMIVMSLLFVGINQMKDLLVEQDAGTLRRQLAGPVTVIQFLVAKVLSSAMVVALALLILLVMGNLFFGVSWGETLPLAAVSVALVFATTGFAALLYALVRTQNQGDAIGSIVVMLMSLLGGAFLPSSMLPGGLEWISRFTLNYWGNESFRTLTAGGGWEDLAAHLPILAAMAVIFTGVGAVLLKQRHLRGAA